MSQSKETIDLPAARTDSAFSIERALSERRSVRAFGETPLTLTEIAQVLWAAQGVTDVTGLRAAPSAGALYPIEVHAVIGDVRQLAVGIYRYEPRRHRLIRHVQEDKRAALARAAYHQNWVASARVILALAALEAHTTVKYGERGRRYVHMEAGHAAQNVLLQATALGFGPTVVGAFADADVARILGLRKGEEPLYLVTLLMPSWRSAEPGASGRTRGCAYPDRSLTNASSDQGFHRVVLMGAHSTRTKSRRRIAGRQAVRRR